MNGFHSEARLDELCSEVAQSLDGFQDSSPSESECESFLASADWLDQGRRRVRFWAGVGLGVLSIVALGVWAFQSVRAPEVLVGPERTPHSSGAWLAAGPQVIPMFFGNGSRVDLDPEARVRVIGLAAESAHLTLEMGQLRARLESDGSEVWRFDAGPFTLTSSGVQFLLSWDPEAQLFEITLSQGAVSVEGPILGESKWVEAGHSLRVSVPDSLAVLTSMFEPVAEPSSLPQKR